MNLKVNTCESFFWGFKIPVLNFVSVELAFQHWALLDMICKLKLVRSSRKLAEVKNQGCCVVYKACQMTSWFKTVVLIKQNLQVDIWSL